MVRIAISKNKVPIRLTEERWFHIVEYHDEVAGYSNEVLRTIEEPEMIIRGWKDEFLAARKINNKYLITVYKEISKKDGFVLTSFSTTKIEKFKRRGIIWRK